MESTRLEETSDIEKLDIMLSSIKSDDSLSEGKVPFVESLKTKTMKDEELEEQRKQIKELKSLVTNLMTQLSRMEDTDKELEDTKSELHVVKNDLAKERSRARKYREAILGANKILAPEAEETKPSQEEGIDNGGRHVKSVTFNNYVETKEISMQKETERVPACLSQSWLGSCPLLLSGNCQKRHPEKLCFQNKKKW